MASEPDHDPTVGAAPGMIARMQADLLDARKRRDPVATSALRTAMAAISNAEAPAVDTVDVTSAAIGSGETGALVDHRRLALSAGELDAILLAEIADRRDTIAQIEPHGRTDEVAELETEISVLERYLS